MYEGPSENIYNICMYVIGSLIEAHLYGIMKENEGCDYDHISIDDSSAQTVGKGPGLDHIYPGPLAPPWACLLHCLGNLFHCPCPWEREHVGNMARYPGHHARTHMPACISSPSEVACPHMPWCRSSPPQATCEFLSSHQVCRSCLHLLWFVPLNRFHWV